jgi:hypothetical protein
MTAPKPLTPSKVYNVLEKFIRETDPDLDFSLANQITITPHNLTVATVVPDGEEVDGRLPVQLHTYEIKWGLNG